MRTIWPLTLRVYLRSRGGTFKPSAMWLCCMGLSPLARRNLAFKCATNSKKGSISARAEEPGFQALALLRLRVYLRSRGGTMLHVFNFLIGQGLSPLARRNLSQGRRWRVRLGSISARAEEPRGLSRQPQPRRVYLRSRGGTAMCAAIGRPCSGLSPLARRNLSQLTHCRERKNF